MNHPDIPKQNGNWSELYDKFPAEYNTYTTVRGRDYKMKVETNTSNFNNNSLMEAFIVSVKKIYKI